jgi:hypothetical protein
MLTWRTIILVGSFLGALVPSIALSQTSQPTSSPTTATAANTPNTPLFPYGSINPQPQGNPLFPFANPTPTNLTPPVADNKKRSSLVPGILYGGAATFGVAGLVGAAAAVSFKTKAKQASNTGPGESPSQEQATEVRQLISSTRTAAILSDISFGLSISCAVGGYFFAKRAKDKPEPTPNKITPY